MNEQNRQQPYRSTKGGDGSSSSSRSRKRRKSWISLHVRGEKILHIIFITSVIIQILLVWSWWGTTVIVYQETPPESSSTSDGVSRIASSEWKLSSRNEDKKQEQHRQELPSPHLKPKAVRTRTTLRNQHQQQQPLQQQPQSSISSNTIVGQKKKQLSPYSMAKQRQEYQDREQQTQQQPYRKWAYAFLMGGCNPKKPNEYRGFIYNILVSAETLLQSGSVADIVVMVQLAYDRDGRNNHTSLPDEDIALLQSLENIRIQYLPTPTTEQNFYSVVLEKFRILTLTQYSRVLFLDGDLWPLCNLDYLFELSEPPKLLSIQSSNTTTSDYDTAAEEMATAIPTVRPQLEIPLLAKKKKKAKKEASFSSTTSSHTATTKRTKHDNDNNDINQDKPLRLKENVVISWKSEPSNAGFFMLQPNLKAFEELQHIIKRRQQHAMTLPYPYFDPVVGWGHVIGSNSTATTATSSNEANKKDEFVFPTIHAPQYDRWRAFDDETGTNWTWYGVHGGQGLLYYFTKYHLQSVSLIIQDVIEQWTHVHEFDADTNVTTKRLIFEDNIDGNQLMKYSCLPMHKELKGEYGNHPRTKSFYYIAPYRDFHHAVGRNKPWEHWELGDINKYYTTSDSSTISAVAKWLKKIPSMILPSSPSSSEQRQPQDEANNAIAVSVFFDAFRLTPVPRFGLDLGETEPFAKFEVAHICPPLFSL